MLDGRKWRVIESQWSLYIHIVFDHIQMPPSALRDAMDFSDPDSFNPNHCTVAQSRFRGKLESSTFHSCEHHALIEIIWPKPKR